MKRHVCYVTGTRADFGLMARTLRRIDGHSTLKLSVAVTGIHLSAAYGGTVKEIEEMGLHIAGRVPVDVLTADGASMARALGAEIEGLVDIFQRESPDMVLLLGDRGEMLAGAIAALHLNIPIVHIHGGERSGTVDEPVRHAISKLAHYHFVATEDARERLTRMGELSSRIFVTGAPGLDGIDDFERIPRDMLEKDHGFMAERPIVLIVYHPVVQTAADSAKEMRTVLAGVAATGAQVLCVMPNSDAGGADIRRVLEAEAGRGVIRSAVHFTRDVYLSWLAVVDVLVGNSSSGIIEAASFGLPVVNVGERQRYRQRNANTYDVESDAIAIEQAVRTALHAGRHPIANAYGDGHAGERIVELLSALPLDQTLLHKSNAY